MKKAFDSIIGNNKVKEILSGAVRDDKLAHAYIILGASGTGKKTLALLIAAAAECEHRHDENYPLPCLVCPSCKKILAGNSPDIAIISREDKQTIGVDKIRNIQSDVYIASNEQINKIYIIEEAHLMTLQAQNAFLTTLEEPPKNVIFLLLSENNEQLLETIKSRAQTLVIEPVEKEDIEAYLTEHFPKAKKLKDTSPESFAEIIASAGGSIGNAIAYLDTKTQHQLLSRRETVKKFLSYCENRSGAPALSEFLRSLPQKRDELGEIFSLCELAVRDITVCKKSGTKDVCFFKDEGEAREAADKYSLARLMSISGALAEARSALLSNANVQITLANLLCDIQKR